MTQLQLKLNENLYLKDPQSTDLGLKIIEKSIEMIDQLGFEGFTFKKLSNAIESTEASIYRYFENKHRLLIYLISWYWSWTEYKIMFETHHLTDPKEQLTKVIEIITAEKKHDNSFPVVDEPALQRIVINESDKTYLTKQVDIINKEGVFKGYKSLCKMIADMAIAINPAFPFPHALISSVLEASHQQIFFSQHLPSLTELKGAEDPFTTNFEFLKLIVFNSLNAK
ncbi:MAG: AcrR family transcriptional regulator [Cyclobacteriaceae bacterium]|jgi:AcrR family transcriptional regulator